MARDATGIAGPVKLKFFHLEGGGLNHLGDYQQAQVLNALNVKKPIAFQQLTLL